MGTIIRISDLAGYIIWITKKQTIIRDERVWSTETSGTALTPEHSSAHCVAEWGESGLNGQVNWSLKIWTVAMNLVPVHVSIALTPSAFGETGQGNGVQGSACCSASLCTADYDHHKCQTLFAQTQRPKFTKVVYSTSGVYLKPVDSFGTWRKWKWICFIC